MHEVAVLSKAVNMAEQVAEQNHISHIQYLRLEVGELTGYLPIFFERYYPIVTENKPVYKDSELKIDIVKGECMCNECHSLYNVMKNKGRCPRCGSRDKTVLSGTEFKVKDIGY